MRLLWQGLRSWHCDLSALNRSLRILRHHTRCLPHTRAGECDRVVGARGLSHGAPIFSDPRLLIEPGVLQVFDVACWQIVLQKPQNEKRGFVRLNACSLATTFGAVGSIVVKIARRPILLLVASLFIAIIYRFRPSRDKLKCGWFSPGSLFAGLACRVTVVLLVPGESRKL
jgi:hypothetical protein